MVGEKIVDVEGTPTSIKIITPVIQRKRADSLGMKLKPLNLNIEKEEIKKEEDEEEDPTKSPSIPNEKEEIKKEEEINPLVDDLNRTLDALDGYAYSLESDINLGKPQLNIAVRTSEKLIKELNEGGINILDQERRYVDTLKRIDEKLNENLEEEKEEIEPTQEDDLLKEFLRHSKKILKTKNDLIDGNGIDNKKHKEFVKSHRTLLNNIRETNETLYNDLRANTDFELNLISTLSKKAKDETEGQIRRATEESIESENLRRQAAELKINAMSSNAVLNPRRTEINPEIIRQHEEFARFKRKQIQEADDRNLAFAHKLQEEENKKQEEENKKIQILNDKTHIPKQEKDREESQIAINRARRNTVRHEEEKKHDAETIRAQAAIEKWNDYHSRLVVAESKVLKLLPVRDGRTLTHPLRTYLNLINEAPEARRDIELLRPGTTTDVFDDLQRNRVNIEDRINNEGGDRFVDKELSKIDSDISVEAWKIHTEGKKNTTKLRNRVNALGGFDNLTEANKDIIKGIDLRSQKEIKDSQPKKSVGRPRKEDVKTDKKQVDILEQINQGNKAKAEEAKFNAMGEEYKKQTDGLDDTMTQIAIGVNQFRENPTDKGILDNVNKQIVKANKIVKRGKDINPEKAEEQFAEIAKAKTQIKDITKANRPKKEKVIKVGLTALEKTVNKLNVELESSNPKDDKVRSLVKNIQTFGGTLTKDQEEQIRKLHIRPTKTKKVKTTTRAENQERQMKEIIEQRKKENRRRR